MGAVVVVIALRRWQNRNLRRAAAIFLLGIAVVPVLWLVYNGAVYGNALEFANGSYSAKAIEQRVGAPNPALHSAGVAAIYFLKSAQLNLAEGNWGRFWLAAALVALAIGAWKLRAQSASMLLLVDSAGLLRAFDCVRFGADSCPHLVAICYFQPALRTPVAADVRGFGRSADCFCLSPWLRGRGTRENWSRCCLR